MMIKMNKKTIFKILSIALMVAMVAMCLGNVALADVDYKPDGTGGATATKFQTILNIFLGLAQVIGIAIAVIMLIVLAIKYISAAPGDKAEIKKHAVVYIVGAVVLFAASGIIQIIKTFAKDTFN
ncbi:MAG: hypothetical protein HFJ44_06355 [Clostridia bacterium]|nr:hypothetical protein [Clostridia bacterium]